MGRVTTWSHVFSNERDKPYFKVLIDRLHYERMTGKIIYPDKKDVFRAFRLTPLAEVKVVIIGQDPYHGPGQADGLSFSVKPGIHIPPSLSNIYKELVSDIPGFLPPTHGCLDSWAIQGVLLLNSILTVEAGRPYSHSNLGWEIFTNQVISVINQFSRNIVFFLWGLYAQRKSILINPKRHCIFLAPHPSPLSAFRGFLGCKHFSKANQWLIRKEKTIINWTPYLPLKGHPID
ncbi:Uracil-DNA glycosylase [Candidatus Erwinia haradaeae]|uniref:Uracil-DNA glycosylase n=1 Tax=Candidatus Erwinia haradaeae TaxID=1922217 RepID=A0A451CZU7_9GAMM|nr:uracil-DNA glycosylase [Candidatus Erwinia haradaeae]VFP78829.1 Uracil-DNA glycosylase [Candidatus Erwinia haradaeae]